MKMMVIFFALMAAVSANVVQPQQASKQALPALEQSDMRDDFGQFTLRYVTADGTVVSERGHFVPTSDGKDKVLIKEGEISYIGDDGKTYISRYTAGLDGTHVTGNYLPVPPVSGY